MGISVFFDFCLSVLSLLGSMFASFSELSIFTVDKVKLSKLSKKGKDGKYLKNLLKNHKKTLVVVLFVNLFFNVSFSIFAQNLLDDWGITISAIISSLVISVTLTLFGEILPKVGGFSLAERSVIVVSKIVFFVSVILKPIVVLANRFVIEPLYGVFGRPHSKSKYNLSKISEVIKRNLKDSKLRKLAIFIDSDVRDIMISFDDFFSISIDSNESTISGKFKKFNMKSNYAIVYQNSRNNIVGCVQINKLIYVISRKEEIMKCLEPVMFVAETKNSYDLFREMKNKKINVAAVVDEYGNIIGIIEKGYILLELFSAIEVEKMGDGYVVRGDVTIDEFNDYFGFDEDSGSYNTISGLIIEKIGRIPSVGEEVEFDDFVVKVLDVKQGKIGRVMIEKKN
jgi:putative hemolysin